MRTKQIISIYIRQLRRAAALMACIFALSPVLALGLTMVSSIAGNAPQVYAQETPAATKDCNGKDVPAKATPPEGAAKTPTVQETPVICESDIEKAIKDANTEAKCDKGSCVIRDYLNPFINTLAAMIGIAVTISIIIAGIRYSTSADNPQKVSEAKQRIVTSIMVLLGFFLFYAILNYVIPGGVAGGQ